MAKLAPEALYHSPAAPGMAVVLPGTGFSMRDAIMLGEKEKSERARIARERKEKNIDDGIKLAKDLNEIEFGDRYAKQGEDMTKALVSRLSDDIAKSTGYIGDNPYYIKEFSNIVSFSKMAKRVENVVAETRESLKGLPIDLEDIDRYMLGYVYDDNDDNPYGVKNPMEVDTEAIEELKSKPGEIMPMAFDIYGMGKKIAKDNEGLSDIIRESREGVGEKVYIEKIKYSMYKKEANGELFRDGKGNFVIDSDNDDVRAAMRNYKFTNEAGVSVSLDDVLPGFAKQMGVTEDELLTDIIQKTAYIKSEGIDNLRQNWPDKEKDEMPSLKKLGININMGSIPETKQIDTYDRTMTILEGINNLDDSVLNDMEDSKYEGKLVVNASFTTRYPTSVKNLDYANIKEEPTVKIIYLDENEYGDEVKKTSYIYLGTEKERKDFVTKLNRYKNDKLPPSQRIQPEWFEHTWTEINKGGIKEISGF